jgi:hypothetical protein
MPGYSWLRVAFWHSGSLAATASGNASWLLLPCLQDEYEDEDEDGGEWEYGSEEEGEEEEEEEEEEGEEERGEEEEEGEEEEGEEEEEGDDEWLEETFGQFDGDGNGFMNSFELAAALQSGYGEWHQPVLARSVEMPLGLRARASNLLHCSVLSVLS